jgi:hypothetical protein
VITKFGNKVIDILLPGVHDMDARLLQAMVF